MPNEITIRPGNRYLAVGKTGSGKTTLAKFLLSEWEGQSIICLDPKGTFDYGVITDDLKEIPALADEYIVVTYRPPVEITGIDHWNLLLRWIYRRMNTLIYIDEVYGLSENGTTYPPMLKGIYTRGRERGISVLACMQRPAGSPRFVRTENEQIACFRLDKTDRKTMASDFSDVAENPIPKYKFWYLDEDCEDPELKYLNLIDEGRNGHAK